MKSGEVVYLPALPWQLILQHSNAILYQHLFVPKKWLGLPHAVVMSHASFAADAEVIFRSSFKPLLDPPQKPKFIIDCPLTLY